MENQIRVLQLTLGGANYTGIAEFLYQYYRHFQTNRVCCDFVFCGENSMKMVQGDPAFSDSEFFTLNSFDGKTVNYTKLVKGLKALFEKKHFDVFHINTHRVGVTILCVMVAKHCGIRTIVSHSHNVRRFIPGKSRKRVFADAVKSVCGDYIRKYSSFLFACSNDAGKALFGEKGIAQENFMVIPNAIDSRRFAFDRIRRNEIREREGLSNKTLVLGQVGRLCEQKNQLFTVRLFSELRKERSDSVLWLIGDGPDANELKMVAEELQVADWVRFMGQRNDVDGLMQAMDIFMIPSTYEGLGIVAIEAQAAGLPTFASLALPPETKVTDLISYHSLEEGERAWAKLILAGAESKKREKTLEQILEAGYDIHVAAAWLEQFYISCGEAQQKG